MSCLKVPKSHTNRYAHGPADQAFGESIPLSLHIQNTHQRIFIEMSVHSIPVLSKFHE